MLWLAYLMDTKYLFECENNGYWMAIDHLSEADGSW